MIITVFGRKLPIIPVILLLGVMGLVMWRVKTTETEINTFKTLANRDTKACIPAFVDGGGPYYLQDQPFRSDLAEGYSTGEKLVVTGRVLRKDCITPVANAILDIWHASSDGNYEDKWFRGRIRTNKQGQYRFESVLPLGYGEGTAYRPPHIHFKVFEGDTERITSQMFFPDVKGKAGFNDAYIMQYERKQESTTFVNYGYHEIVLP